MIKCPSCSSKSTWLDSEYMNGWWKMQCKSCGFEWKHDPESEDERVVIRKLPDTQNKQDVKTALLITKREWYNSPTFKYRGFDVTYSKNEEHLDWTASRDAVYLECKSLDALLHIIWLITER